MTAYNYSRCLDNVFKHEGGYQNDPNDTGNWTGCEKGKGTNKGTNRGISACSYPNENIKGMTEERAGEIYHDDFWEPILGDDLPAGVDLCTFDGSVNSGKSRGVKWLQQAVGVTADGIVGPITVDAARAADDHSTIDRMCDLRLDFLRGLSTWDLYGKGWTTRVEDVRTTAHGMVREEVRPQVASITVDIGVPDGIAVTFSINGEFVYATGGN
jgi:lysozyme family protein